MGTQALTDLATLFRRRFLFNALLPTFVFTSLTVAVVVHSTSSLPDAAKWWTELDTFSKILVALVYIGGTWFLATAVASQWRGIVRLFEGYPAVALAERLHLPVPGRAWHQQRMLALRVGPTANAAEAYRLYPASHARSRILPTRLGNVLLAAERYPADRYGVDPIRFWPRLFPLLPERFRTDYEEFLIQQEFPLVIAFLSAVTAVLTGAVLLVTQGSPLLFVFCFGGGLLVAFAFYRLSESGARALGEQLRTAFDLYRDRLLDQWPTPADVRDEREAFALIHRFMLLGNPPDWEKPQDAHAARRQQDATVAGEDSSAPS